MKIKNVCYTDKDKGVLEVQFDSGPPMFVPNTDHDIYRWGVGEWLKLGNTIKYSKDSLRITNVTLSFLDWVKKKIGY